MIIIDADVLIAFFRKEDQVHNRATELFNDIEESAGITTVTLSEVLTFIKGWDGGTRAKEVWNKIEAADIEVLEIKEVLEDIIYFIEKFDKISFGDASSIAITKKFNIQKIYSFDSDFDLVPGIQRIY